MAVCYPFSFIESHFGVIANRKKEIVLLLSILTLAGLYDLHRGPGERYNVMEFNPEIVEKLEKIANEAREDLRMI